MPGLMRGMTMFFKVCQWVAPQALEASSSESETWWRAAEFD